MAQQANTDDSSLPFQKLTPEIGTKKDVYAKSFDFAFEHNDLRNIAVSGGYGVGKTSVIKTYEKCSNKSFIYISLPNFTLTEKGLCKADDEACIESEASQAESPQTQGSKPIEQKIIKQLLHQIQPKNIPLTSFKIKRKTSLGSARWLALKTLYFSLFSLWFIFPTEFMEKFELITGQATNALWPLLVKLFLAIVCFYFVFSFIVNAIRRQGLLRALRKLSFMGAELEISENDSKGSYFDQHFSEIVYLFNNCGVNAIVFEDLDRFDANYLFKRLREINTAVNNLRGVAANQAKGESEPLRFFYLLRDDTFTSNDRSKFFDFIIPIIPVTDTSNSYDQLLKMLGDICLTDEAGENLDRPDKIKASLLSYCSLFIADMRLLKNIVNEFNIYIQKLAPKQTSYKYSKQFAMIVYKNLFPKDFTLLQQEKSLLNHLFSLKDEMLTECASDLTKQVKELEIRIQQAENEHLKNQKELMLVSIADWSYDGIYIENKRIDLHTPGGKDAFAEALLTPNIESITGASRNGSWVYSSELKADLTKLMETSEYTARTKVLEDKANTEQLKQKIQALTKEQQEIILLSFGKLCKQYRAKLDPTDKSKDIFCREHSRASKDFKYLYANKDSMNLIRFLIEEEFISKQDYADYTTPFEERSLKHADKEFLKSLHSPQPLPFTHELQQVSEVVRRSADLDYQRAGILNITLLNHLLSHQADKKCRRVTPFFFETLAKQEDYKFFKAFFAKDQLLPVFIPDVLKVWPDFLNTYDVRHVFTVEQFVRFLGATLAYCSPETLKRLNSLKRLKDLLDNETALLQCSFDDPNVIVGKLKELEVCVRKLTQPCDESRICHAIYQQHMYDLSYENICFILECFYEIKDTGDYHSKNYTLICSEPKSPLAQYIYQDINTYMSLLLEHYLGEDFADDEDYVQALLNNVKLTLENKQLYLARCATKITDISLVNDVQPEGVKGDDTQASSKTLWQIILEQGCAAHTPGNILWYFYESGLELDDALITFINSFTTPVKFQDSQFPDEQTVKKWDKNKLFKAVRECSELNDGVYISILKSLRYYIGSFSTLGLKTEKVHLLVEADIVKLAANSENDESVRYVDATKNLEHVREHYPDHVISLILRNQAVYMAMMRHSAGLIEVQEVLSLSENGFADDKCIELLGLRKENIAFNNTNTTLAVKNYILEHFWDQSDIKEVIGNYDAEDASTQDIISTFAENNLQLLLDNDLAVPFRLLQRLAEIDGIDADALLTLMSKQLQSSSVGNQKGNDKVESFLSPQDIHNFLKSLNCPEYLKLFTAKQAKLEATEANIAFTNALLQAAWIKKIDSESEDGKLLVWGTKKIKISS